MVMPLPSMFSQPNQHKDAIFMTRRLQHSSGTSVNGDAFTSLCNDHRIVEGLFQKLLPDDNIIGAEGGKKEEPVTQDPSSSLSSPFRSRSVHLPTTQPGVPAGDVLEKHPTQVKTAQQELHPELKRDTLNELIRQLSIHSVVEEQYIYPLIKTNFNNGSEIVKRSLNEHQQLKELLLKLDSFSSNLTSEPKDWPEFPLEDIRTLQQHFLEHIHEEENTIFPSVSKTLTKGELQSLNQTVEDAKLAAPTRPHPLSPDKPPLIHFTAPIAGIVDKTKDILRESTSQTTYTHDTIKANDQHQSHIPPNASA